VGVLFEKGFSVYVIQNLAGGAVIQNLATPEWHQDEGLGCDLGGLQGIQAAPHHLVQHGFLALLAARDELLQAARNIGLEGRGATHVIDTAGLMS
jgi:hypothetical protein